VAWLFLAAYTCSGLAGLIYEVCWTRLLTLYIGHTTAAASAVVAAFLGGLAVGAAAAGPIASRLSPRQALQAYIGLELGVVVAAWLLPYELSALTPVLRWAYGDGDPSLLFPVIRVTACLIMVAVPAVALGATFPMAIRWLANGSSQPARQGSALYFLNTAGAAAGALLAGFVLIPRIGIAWTTSVGMAASLLAAACVWVVLRSPESPAPTVRRGESSDSPVRPALKSRPNGRTAMASDHAWLPAVVLGLSGFASLLHEIAWTRILSLVLGPTTYAFAAALAAVIAGVALGSGAGTWIVARTRRPAAWLAAMLSLAALITSWTYSLAGNQIPMMVARQVAGSSGFFDQLVAQGALLTAALVVPTAACLGAAFPLALALATDPSRGAPARFSMVYAVNTVGAVSGSLAAGFWLIPSFGLQPTLWVASACLVIAALIVVDRSAMPLALRLTGAAMAVITTVLIASSPAWDRELLASGVYMYAPYVPPDLDLETQLKAGTLLYYREGASATVSVKRLTGTTTLGVDGKTDASNRGDMLTQKLVAHLPLLLHDNPREVGIIGLGSGVTLGAALAHPITRADVLEISPEVVQASSFFRDENRNALADPRTRLIVGDGRSHVLLGQRKYDVIVSEPSNPWIAGVAALFTEEFFTAARGRLAPGGIMCQWANAYNISDADLRSILATFRSAFPDGTAWLVGGDDVLMIGSATPLGDRLANIEHNWNRPGVAADLATVAVTDPFSLYSLYVAGPGELAAYAGAANVFTDDSSRLEFSAPRELHNRNAGQNGAALVQLLGNDGGPAVIRDARRLATASQWRARGDMMAKADVYRHAYDDYARALTLDPRDRPALHGLVRLAVLTKRGTDALALIRSLVSNGGEGAAHGSPVPQDPEILVASSKLLASIGSAAEGVAMAREAASRTPVPPIALEQLASLQADAGDLSELDFTATALRKLAPQAPAGYYYAGAAAFMRGDVEGAVKLCEQAIALDQNYAPVYDLLGAAQTRLQHPAEARAAFEKSLAFDAHDSTAYTNLGVLELGLGHRQQAANYFAEALWLSPDSPVARQGLAESTR
jgi:spermidine synthase